MSRHAMRARDYLGHMSDAVGQIQAYVSGKSAGDFLSDRLLQDKSSATSRFLARLPGIFSTLFPMHPRSSPAFLSPRFTVCAISFRTGILLSIGLLFGK
jgi:hypothetical protein